MKWITLTAAAAAATLALAACGSGDDARPTLTAGTPARTRVAATATAGADVMAEAQGTLTALEMTAVSVQGNVNGGNSDSTPQTVSTVPPVTPPAGATPQVDPTEIAQPDPTAGGIEIIVDMDASKAGIQSTRDVTRGDVFKVAVVIANAPVSNNGIGGVSAFNFIINYDKTKIVAPSISGGPAINRNPDLNETALGDPEAGWQCLPAPEGDMDDPGGIDGDFDPATGQALLSCFTAGKGTQSGDLVLAVVTFTAIAEGSTDLTLAMVEVSDPVTIAYAHCAGDQSDPIVPCQNGTVTVR